MTNSFVERLIDVTFVLAQNPGTNQPNTFPNNTNKVTLSGYRTSVRIASSGAAGGNEATVDIFGLDPAVMQQMATLGLKLQANPGNTVIVTAGTPQSGMATVFQGTIYDAYADYNAQPAVPFKVQARAGSYESTLSALPVSFNGKTAVATILSAIAQNQGWGFENNGVTEQLSNPYYSGAPMDQIQAIKRDAKINAELLPGNSVTETSGRYTLSIWPLYGARAQANGVPLISKDTGMVGFPSFTAPGIMVKTLFDPRIVFGGQFKVESSIFTPGTLARLSNDQSLWNCSKLDLALDAKLPKGHWMATVYGFNPGTAQPTVVQPR